MKTKLSLIALVILVSSACNKPNEPYNPYDPYESVSDPVAKFEYKIQQPLTVALTNLSYDATSYKWSFGDGATSNSKNPTHRYTAKGVYKITLTATSGSGFYQKTATASATVTIENPTKIYVSGFKVNEIPYENQYYYVRLIDDDFFTTQWSKTNYFLLSSANIPYDYIFSSPVLMDGLYEDDYYVVELYYNTKNSGNGTKVGSYKIQTTDIYKYPEEITGGDDNFSITTYFSYR